MSLRALPISQGKLTNYINDGSLTTSIRERATTRLPPVSELFNVIGISASLETQNLVLPATITGNLNLQYYQGSNLETCAQKAVFMATEVKYEKLYDGCNWTRIMELLNTKTLPSTRPSTKNNEYLFLKFKLWFIFV